jgi:hypothetical protein
MSDNADRGAANTRLGRAVRAVGRTNGTGRPHREEHPQTNWLRDVILGGQDGLVNILGIILGVIAGGGSKSVLLAAGFAGAFTESISTGQSATHRQCPNATITKRNKPGRRSKSTRRRRRSARRSATFTQMVVIGLGAAAVGFLIGLLFNGAGA